MVNTPIQISAFELSKWLQSEEDKPIIIDVREEKELDIAKFPLDNINIPISKVNLTYVKSNLDDFKNRQFVILCHMGIRSYHFGQWLLENNLVKEVWNLDKGIDGWSKDIDKKVPRY